MCLLRAPAPGYRWGEGVSLPRKVSTASLTSPLRESVLCCAAAESHFHPTGCFLGLFCFLGWGAVTTAAGEGVVPEATKMKTGYKHLLSVRGNSPTHPFLVTHTLPASGDRQR